MFIQEPRCLRKFSWFVSLGPGTTHAAGRNLPKILYLFLSMETIEGLQNEVKRLEKVLKEEIKRRENVEKQVLYEMS